VCFREALLKNTPHIKLKHYLRPFCLYNKTMNPLPEIIKTTTTIQTYSPQHCLLLLSVEQLVKQLNPVRWIHNRPADETRVTQIASSIYRNRSPFDTIIHLHYNHATNQFEILDGLHRYSACKYIYDNNSKPNPDYITGDEYGYGRSAAWFYNSTILVSLHINKTLGELHLIFENLNKAVPVSEIYIPPMTADIDNLRKQKVIETAIKYQRLFPKHFSASNSFQVPNMNRDRFMDVLAELFDIIGKDYELDDALHIANREFESNYIQGKIKLSDSTSKKCRENGCWLFIYKGDTLVQKIANLVII